MRNLVRVPNNLLVINGEPYSLVREVKITDPSPCHLCDLFDMCQHPKAGSTLMKLCSPKNGTGGEFFVKDFEISAKSIQDYIDIELVSESPVDTGK